MSDRRLIFAEGFEAAAAFTPAIAYKDWIFTSGLTAVHPISGAIPGDVTGNVNIPLAGDDRTFREVRHIYSQLAAVVAAAGGQLKDCVRLDQFVTSSDLMDAHHQARRGLLAEPRPASTSVEIGALLSPKAHFSIEMLGICPRPGFEKTPVNSDALPQPIGGYSPAIRAGDFVFVAGQVPTDWQSSVAPEAQVNPGFWAGNKIDREARYILGHVASVLEAAGSSLQNTVKVNIHLRDMNDIPRLDHVWREYFPIDPPARTIFPVNGLGAKESRIEITVIAVTNDGNARKEVIATKSARSPLFHESQAVRAGDFLFLSGVLAADGNGLIEAARPKPNLPYERYSAGAQMADILAQAESICAAAGADLRNCLRMHNVYRDLHDYASARAVQEPYFSKGMPTVSTLQVSTDLQVPGCTVISDFWVAMKD